MSRLIQLLFALVLAGAAFCSSALEPEHSGAWYQPSNSGWGITLHVWDGGAVMWVFAHGDSGGVWFISDVDQDGNFELFWPNSNAFPVAPILHMIPAGTATLTPAGDNLVLQWDILADCGLQASPVPTWCGTVIDSVGSAVLTRLTP